jgi:hypothetical protein
MAALQEEQAWLVTEALGHCAKTILRQIQSSKKQNNDNDWSTQCWCASLRTQR